MRSAIFFVALAIMGTQETKLSDDGMWVVMFILLVFFLMDLIELAKQR